MIDDSESEDRTIMLIGSTKGTGGCKMTRKWTIRTMVEGDWEMLCQSFDSEAKKLCDYSTIDYDLEFRVEDGWTDGFFVAEDIESEFDNFFRCDLSFSVKQYARI